MESLAKVLSTEKSKEEQLYEPIMNALKRELEKYVGFGGKVHLEITANGKFSDDLKEVLDDRALSILRVEKFFPDMTGFLQKKDSSLRELITAEVKDGKIKIRHVSRAKLYADIFSARYGLLISPERIPEEIRRFLKDRTAITYRLGGSLIVVQYDMETNEFKFDKQLYLTVPEPFKST